MGYSFTASKTTHRAGSQIDLKRFVKGELPLPFYEVSGASSVNWSDGGKGGRFLEQSANSAVYQPANRSQVVVISATPDGGGDPLTALLTVEGTFPLYPTKGYEIEFDEDTKEERAKDGTLYQREDYQPQISWKMSFDRRLKDETKEVWDFLLFHRKIKQFWVYDEEKQIANKVRRVSSLPQRFESANSWTSSVVVRGDFAPVEAPPYAPAHLRIGAGNWTEVEPYVSDRYFLDGEVFGFGSISINNSGVTDPAPDEIYKYCRYHETQFSYKFTQLIAGHNYAVRIHTCSNTERIFDVVANGVTEASGASSSDAFRAAVTEFTTDADANGILQLDFIKVSGVNVLVSAIEVIE